MSSTSKPDTDTREVPPRFRKVWSDGYEDSNLDDGDSEKSKNQGFEPERESTSIELVKDSFDLAPERENPLTPPKEGKIGLNTDFNAKHGIAAQVAFRNIPNLQEIIDSVVSSNISRVTPPSSRPSTPPPPRKALSRTTSLIHIGQHSQGPPGLQSTSSTPAEKWSSLSSRRSNRRFDVRPWGPRHLEYDYNEARKEFQSAAYYALGQFGYTPPSRTTLSVGKVIINPNSLPSMNDLRRIALFRSACEKLDAADAALEEAISRGETWENTPVPAAYCSLEGSKPEDIRSVRSDEPERLRSALTFEEDATLIVSPVSSTDMPPSVEIRDRKDSGVVIASKMVALPEAHTMDNQPGAGQGSPGHRSCSSSVSSSSSDYPAEESEGIAAKEDLGSTVHPQHPQTSSVACEDPRMADLDRTREPMSGRSTPSNDKARIHSRSSTPVNTYPTMPRKRGRPRKNRD